MTERIFGHLLEQFASELHLEARAFDRGDRGRDRAGAASREELFKQTFHMVRTVLDLNCRSLRLLRSFGALRGWHRSARRRFGNGDALGPDEDANYVACDGLLTSLVHLRLLSLVWRHTQL